MDDSVIITGEFKNFLCSNQLIMVVTSYKNGEVLILDGDDNNVNINNINENRPLTIFVDRNELYISNKLFIKKYVVCKPDNSSIKIELNSMFFTSDIDIHDIFKYNDEIYFCSSLLNSVCKLSLQSDKVLKLFYTPKFITERVLEDRCHLNGATIHNGDLFLTCVSSSNIYGGWKYNKCGGGIIIHVNTGNIILNNLSMPHSPNYHGGYIYFLNSGKGEVCKFNLETKELIVITFIKGFLRGLTIFEKDVLYGVVTCSKDRHEECFRGLELEKLISDYNDVSCGLYLIDLNKTGINAVIGNIILNNHHELYDVDLVDLCKKEFI